MNMHNDHIFLFISLEPTIEKAITYKNGNKNTFLKALDVPRRKKALFERIYVCIGVRIVERIMH